MRRRTDGRTIGHRYHPLEVNPLPISPADDGDGVAALAVAVGPLAGQDWARAVGMVMAGIGCVANFVFLPYFPWWSLTILAFNIAVIWALSSQIGRGPTTR